MDHSWPIRAVENDEFEQVRAAVWTEHEVTARILTYLLDDDRMAQRVVNVVGSNAVLERRSEHVHH